MATISRRTFAQLLTEHISRMGQSNASGTTYSDRAKVFIDTAHRWCGAVWHHHQLDTTNTALTATTGSAVVDVSSLNALAILNVDLKTVTGDTFIKTLEFSEFRSVRPLIERKNAQPDRWSRFGDNLVFNCLSDQAYQLDIDYYARTTSLEDDASTLDLGEEWDDAVLVRSLVLGHTNLRTPSLASLAKEEFTDIVSLLPNPLLVEMNFPGEPIRSTRSYVEPHGGKQG